MSEKPKPLQRPKITAEAIGEAIRGFGRIRNRLDQVENTVATEKRTLNRATRLGQGDDLADWDKDQLRLAALAGIELQNIAQEAREACTELMAAWKAKRAV